MSDRLTLATWNINSVRLRAPLVEKLIADEAPDVICLQETKCPNDAFPTKAFRKLGYEHIEVNGQKGYHGVAVLSRRPLTVIDRRDLCDKGDARHLSVSVPFGGTDLVVHNFYVPAGGDEPDPEVNDKFAHKLAYLDEMRDWLQGAETEGPAVLLGDLNVAPLEHDVWSHKQLLKVVSHTPPETERLNSIIAAGGWIDVMRRFVPEDEKLFTWWSYRAKDWRKANRGRRLDHVWATPPLEVALAGMRVLTDARDWERPSDHVPVIARFEAP
ncbi:MAG: exodeoxyribonuclease III [Hyphomicrobiales bacterium]|nr:MAG: exodeoxyribonuclease III [Hyphomicrobiales bacterium]